MSGSQLSGASFTFTLNGVDFTEQIKSVEWVCQRPALPKIERVTGYTAEGTITFERADWERIVDALTRHGSRYWQRRRRWKNERLRRRAARAMGMTWRQWRAWVKSMYARRHGNQRRHHGRGH